MTRRHHNHNGNGPPRLPKSLLARMGLPRIKPGGLVNGAVGKLVTPSIEGLKPAREFDPMGLCLATHPENKRYTKEIVNAAEKMSIRAKRRVAVVFDSQFPPRRVTPEGVDSGPQFYIVDRGRVVSTAAIIDSVTRKPIE